MADEPDSREPALDELVRRCHRAGLRVTPQRVAVYRAVLASREHPGPEEVFRSVRPSMRSLSLGTVYKTLDTLEELGLVTRVASLGGTRRYDGNRERHHHLVCTRCRRIMDFQDEGFDRLRPSRPIRDFMPEAISVHVFGLCRACRQGRV